MLIRSIVKMFRHGNVCVTGLRGCGKDMLMSNVVVRRHIPYVSNTDYGGLFNPLDFDKLDCGKNDYRNFISGKLKYYQFPYDDGTDIYISDCGVYLPSQYCNELNRDYKYLPTFFALSRHLGSCNVHVNVQHLGRAWDKIREQSDQYITCLSCHVFGSLVIQRIRLHDKYQSCLDRVPPFPIRKPLLSPTRKMQWELSFGNYVISHGEISDHWLIYVNRSNYNTRLFKELLLNGNKSEKK